MTSIGDIFDLPESSEVTNDKPVKKERKKPELSEEKRAAMLERLAKGREMRAQKLAEKKGINKGINKEVKKEVKTTIEDHEAERLAFVNMMAGKSKPLQKDIKVDKFERPKKKVYEPKLSNEVKIETQQKEEKKEINKPITVAPIVHSVPAPIVPPTPIVIRTFKKPMWG